MSLQVEVGRTGLFIQIDETVLNLNTSQITVVSGNVDTLNGQAGSYYLDRSNHTGTQAISTIDNLQDALDLKLDAADYNDRFLGLYASLFDLQAAHPTASAGDYAQVDLGIGTDVIVYAWDVNDAKWAAVGSSAIANTDALPEGSSNLYHTSQRVRDTPLTGFTASNAPITATDSVLQAAGKAQGQISALATVAQTGSYNDLTDKPTIEASYKTLVAMSASNKIITSDVNATIYSSDKTAFNADVTLATTLYTTYVCEIDLLLDFPTVQPAAVGVRAFINGAIIPLSTEMQMGTGAVNSASVYKVRLEIARYSGNRFGVSGFGHGLNGAIFTYSHASEIYGSATFNVCVRFTGTPQIKNKIVVKSARLYQLNNAP